MATESRSAVGITVEGFEVTSACDRDELDGLLADAAYEIAQEIGMALSSLGTSSIHGKVTVTCEGVTRESSDDD